MAGLCAQVDTLEARVVHASGDAATLGNGSAVDLLQVAGEVNGAGVADGGADSEDVDRRTCLLEVADPLGVQAPGDHNAHMLVACLVQARADLLDEVGGHPATLGGGVKP